MRPSSLINLDTDKCACKCFNPNGILILIAVQVLVFIAACFSTVAMVDCHFVSVDAAKVDPALAQILKDTFGEPATVDVNNDKRGLGFFFYEGVDGDCTWEHFEDLDDRFNSSDIGDRLEDGFDAYLDFLGADWDAPRGLGVTAAAAGWLLMMWLLAFCCVSHPKVLRWVVGVLVVILCAVFQASTFAVLNSDICDKFACDLGRSARFAVTATILAAVAGVLMLFTKDHPGQQEAPEPTLVLHAEKDVVSVTENHHSDEEAAHVYTNEDGTTLVQEIPVRDFDGSLVESTDKKSIDHTTAVVIE
jgi:hypothetical protein